MYHDWCLCSADSVFDSKIPPILSRGTFLLEELLFLIGLNVFEETRPCMCTRTRFILFCWCILEVVCFSAAKSHCVHQGSTLPKRWVLPLSWKQVRERLILSLPQLPFQSNRIRIPSTFLHYVTMSQIFLENTSPRNAVHTAMWPLVGEAQMNFVSWVHDVATASCSTQCVWH